MGIIGGHFKLAMPDQFLLIRCRGIDLFHQCGKGMAAAMRCIQVRSVRVESVYSELLQNRIEDILTELPLFSIFAIGKERYSPTPKTPKKGQIRGDMVMIRSFPASVFDPVMK